MPSPNRAPPARVPKRRRVIPDSEDNTPLSPVRSERTRRPLAPINVNVNRSTPYLLHHAPTTAPRIISDSEDDAPTTALPSTEKSAPAAPLSRLQLRRILQSRLEELAPGMTLEELMKEKDPDETEDRWLNQVWSKPAPAPTNARGFPGKSGEKQIRDAAAECRRTATPRPNPAAEAEGLGACEIAPADPNYSTKRPRHRGVRATIDGKVSRRATMTYHLTWVAENGYIPPGPGGERLQFSHRCHQPCCINPRHGRWEREEENKSREMCREDRGGSYEVGREGKLVSRCPHQPCCLAAVE